MRIARGSKVAFVVSISVMVLIVDSLLLMSYDLQNKQSSWYIPTFAIICSIYSIVQYILLDYVKNAAAGIKSHNRPGTRKIHHLVKLAQYILTSLIVLLILQIIVGSYYSSFVLVIVTTISYGLGITLLFLLTRRFFSWYRIEKNFLLLLYTFAVANIIINLCSGMIFLDVMLFHSQATVTDRATGSSVFIPRGSPEERLSIFNNVSSVLSFATTWFASAFLLHYYSRKFGTIKYSVIIALPLVYFLTPFLTPFLDILEPFMVSDPILFTRVLTIATTSSKLAGGILFGVPFWIIAKTLTKNSTLRSYMVISGYGFVLLFLSNQGVAITITPYPPFGIATISFIGLSTYLVLIGIFYSAVSVSEDAKIRQSIRKTTADQYKLLLTIGSAQMDQDIENRVLGLVKANSARMREESGIQGSLSEIDMKDYVNDVLKEIKTSQYLDQASKKEKQILEGSMYLFVCSKTYLLRSSYNKYFHLYEKIMYQKGRAQHKGIRMTIFIDKGNLEVARAFLNIGVEVRHVENLPPNDFIVSDKQVLVASEDMDPEKQQLLNSNDSINYYISIFEDLWKKGIDAEERLRDVE
jgi:hypothetical protein